MLNQYTVMQQNAWAGRRFFTAQDRRTGQVVYLIEEPAGGTPEPYTHPSLPPMLETLVESDVRWLTGTIPEGETLEDLRNRGRLSEQDILAVLLSVLDGLTSLVALEPPVVPSYLDPSCIKRDRLNRWVLDYPALAHAPEARMNASVPLGVHPFGVLLYWLMTGQAARRTRVQVTRIPQGASAALQFILIKCLGRSYESLGAVRADVERAGSEHEFRSLIQLIAQQRDQLAAAARVAGRPPEPSVARVATQAPQPPRVWVLPTPSDPVRPLGPVPRQGEAMPIRDVPVVNVDQAPPKESLSLEYRKVPIGGPFIPTDDRPWALPKSQDGFRKFVVPPPPNPVLERAKRWGAVGGVALAAAVLAGVVAWKAGLMPAEIMPAFLKPAHPVSADLGFARAGVQVGSELPPEPAGPGAQPSRPNTGAVVGAPIDPDLAESRRNAEARRQQIAAGGGGAPPPAPVPTTPTPPPARPAPTPPPANPKPAPPVPAPQPENPASGPPPPSPGSVAFLDAQTGGTAILLYLDGNPTGYAYMFPHPRSPYISLGAFNALFARNLYWAPVDGGGIRLFTGDGSHFTTDFDLVAGRLWLRLTPALQQVLGIQLQSATSSEFHFIFRRV